MNLTYQMLIDTVACDYQVALYKENFPDNIKITLSVCKKAAKIGLDLDWFARHFLTAQAEKVYQEATAPAYKVYQEATAQAEKVYQEATAPAYKVYQEATAPADKVYQEATAPAYKVYQEATAQAYKVYQEAKAPALFKAIKWQEGNHGR
jgi:vacuolar-type H+-ATPase subunit H